MKVLTRAEFLALEGPLLYSTWRKDWGHPDQSIEIKYQTMGNDWVCQGLDPLFSSIPEHPEVKEHDVWDYVAYRDYKGSIKIDLEFAGRDGCFDEDDRYVVFEANDVAEVLRKVNECYQQAVLAENIQNRENKPFDLPPGTGKSKE